LRAALTPPGRTAPHPNFQLARRRRPRASLQEYQDRFAFMQFDNRRMYSAMVSFLDDQVPSPSP
jgi:hypothetical protein